jgi:hypothetical protein
MAGSLRVAKYCKFVFLHLKCHIIEMAEYTER